MLKTLKQFIFGPQWDGNVRIYDRDGEEVEVLLTALNKKVDETPQKLAELAAEYRAFKPGWRIKERPDGEWGIERQAMNRVSSKWNKVTGKVDQVEPYNEIVWKDYHYGYTRTLNHGLVLDYFDSFDDAESYLQRLIEPAIVQYDACGNEIELSEPETPDC